VSLEILVVSFRLSGRSLGQSRAHHLHSCCCCDFVALGMCSMTFSPDLADRIINQDCFHLSKGEFRDISSVI
jgi:hypothetical protein